MPSYNSITIVGNTGGEPEMRFTPDGKCITSFTVAVNDAKLVGGEWKENVEWFRVVSFGKLAERLNERLTKGEPVLCVGKLKLNRWTDNNGEKRVTLEVLANRVVSFSKSKKEKYEGVADEGDISPDEIPF
jgi:single-strand DNA-binding protein